MVSLKGVEMASVRIEEEAFTDPRIELLAQRAGWNRYEALGRLAFVWRVCTQRETYYLDAVWVEACLGPGGVEHLVASGLGEKTERGIRIRGTEGRIEWLKQRREAGRKGGQANKSRASSKTKQTGSKTQANESKPEAKQSKGEANESKPEANASRGEASAQAKDEQNEANHTPLTLTLSLPSEDSLPTPSGVGSPGDGKSNGKAKKPRERNPLFDAIADVTGMDPATAGSHIGKVAATLAKADPPYTPEDVFDFGHRYHQLCTYAARDNRQRPELAELQKHIGKVRVRVSRLPQQQKPDPFAAENDPDAGLHPDIIKRMQEREKDHGKPAA